MWGNSLIQDVADTNARTLTLTSSASTNYEAIVDTSQPCQYSIRVTDKGDLTYDASVRITINDINDPPVIASSQSCNVLENLPRNTILQGCEINATDEDSPAQLLLWSKVNGAGSIDVAGSGATSCTLKVVGDIDYEEASTLTIRLKVIDPDGGSDTADVTINVVDQNDAPTFTCNVPNKCNAGGYREMLENMADVPIPELWKNRATNFNGRNLANLNPITVDVPNPVLAFDQDTSSSSTAKWGQLEYTIDGNSNGFGINSNTGVLHLVTAKDYESLRAAGGTSSAVASVTVKACDKADSPKCTTADVTVYIKDVDEPPVMIPFADGENFLVSSSAVVGDAVGLPAKWTDPDIYKTSSSITSCSIVNVTKDDGTVENDRFTIDGQTCQVYLGKASLAQNDKYSVYIKSMDHSLPYCTYDGGNDGFNGYGVTDCKEYGNQDCSTNAGGGECDTTFKGLTSNIIEMRVVVGTSGTPPVMGPTQIFTMLENSDRFDVVSRYLKCFDVDVIKERTPACVIDYDNNRLRVQIVLKFLLLAVQKAIARMSHLNSPNQIQCLAEIQLQMPLLMSIVMEKYN